MARKPIVYKNANSDGSIKSTHSSGNSGGNSGGSSAPSGTGTSKGSSIPTGNYTQGDKYAGGTTFTRPDGSQYNVDGSFTSPSGKMSEISGGKITTTGSKDKNQIGTVYTNDGTGNYSSDYKVLGSYTKSADYDDTAGLQVSALRKAMNSSKDALEDAFDASLGTLNNSVTRGKQDAYIAQQKALKTLPQAMAAAGYNGGVTESTAAGLAGDYQNALLSLENQKAEELARLQSDKAQGIANVDANYQTQIANALQTAQQMAYQREQDAAQLELQQRAAALAEQQAQQKNTGGGSSKSEPRLTYAQAVEQINAGNTSDIVKQAAAYWGLTIPVSNAPAKYQDAQRMAAQQGSLTPIAAYWKSQGYTDAQIASMLNQSVNDPESAYYGQSWR